MLEGNVSVVVPTRNSAEFLEACLRSIRSQRYGDLELIVVDNSSTDGTPSIARCYADTVITAGPERSAQRNLGARHAQGKYLLFVDSDMVLDADVVEQCVGQLQSHPDCAAVIIPEVSCGDGFWARCKALERSCYLGDDSIEAPRFFARTAFDSIGGFDETLNGPEDWDLARRVRSVGATCRVPAFIHHMEGHLTLTETMHAKFYYGLTMGRYLRKHSGGTVQRQLMPIRAAYLRHWKRLLRDPIHLGGFAVMKACEIAAGATGAVVGLRRDAAGRSSGGAS
jgi:glycosyltransferase involved in cell wall biosynthesis